MENAKLDGHDWTIAMLGRGLVNSQLCPMWIQCHFTECQDGAYIQQLPYACTLTTNSHTDPDCRK